mmetsp:Transcript_10405/g.21922  ORF Transcript_10405/g.21922 Transcript_10405/m.21922 type:complete len:215 (-) Transcript_10405:585-1229(-)
MLGAPTQPKHLAVVLLKDALQLPKHRRRKHEQRCSTVHNRFADSHLHGLVPDVHCLGKLHVVVHGRLERKPRWLLRQDLIRNASKRENAAGWSEAQRKHVLHGSVIFQNCGQHAGKAARMARGIRRRQPHDSIHIVSLKVARVFKDSCKHHAGFDIAFHELKRIMQERPARTRAVGVFELKVTVLLIESRAAPAASRARPAYALRTKPARLAHI